MNRKKQRCPYCGRRMSYINAYFSRRKAQYTCTRCGKESRVVISKIIIPVFIIVAVISLAIMGLWFLFKLLSNPLGILLVAAPLVIFLLFTPKFVYLEPLKKYKKSMEAKKAGMEYSDNLVAAEFDEDMNTSLENSMQFKINSDLFNQIKSERSTAKKQAESQEIVSHSETIDKDSYVHVIDDVSEDHASTTAVPLKKIHSEGTPVRSRHYLPPMEEAETADEEASDDDVKEYVKPDTNKYSGNRRF